MLLENQKIDVRVTNITEEYFKKIGYKVKNGDKISIPIEELPRGSGLKVLVMCDYCNCIFEKQWKKILMSKDDCCKDCKTKKMMKTSLERYGNVCSLHNPKIEQKMKENNLKKFGVEFPLQNKEILKKTRNNISEESFFERITSKQQKKIHILFGGTLNYQIYPYIVDIFFPDEKIYFEYDGGGHNLAVKLKQKDEEQFKKEEETRTLYLKDKGLKEFRIVDSSKKGKLLEDNVMLKIKERAFNLLSKEYTSYVYNIDNNTETYWK